MVIWASPLSLTMSLSIPLGPNVLASVSATARHADMLDNSCPFPWDESVPSLRRTTVGCCVARVQIISTILRKGIAHHRQRPLHFWSDLGLVVVVYWRMGSAQDRLCHHLTTVYSIVSHYYEVLCRRLTSSIFLSTDFLFRSMQYSPKLFRLCHVSPGSQNARVSRDEWRTSRKGRQDTRSHVLSSRT